MWWNPCLYVNENENEYFGWWKLHQLKGYLFKLNIWHKKLGGWLLNRKKILHNHHLLQQVQCWHTTPHHTTTPISVLTDHTPWPPPTQHNYVQSFGHFWEFSITWSHQIPFDRQWSNQSVGNMPIEWNLKYNLCRKTQFINYLGDCSAHKPQMPCVRVW